MPNMSNIRYAELLNKEKQLEQELIIKAIGWIGDKLGHALAVQLAYKPWIDWTEKEKNVLTFVCKGATTALELYISLLPQEKDINHVTS